jgi:1,4-dihydroxy-2-naphthoyl-CoA hydrolase
VALGARAGASYTLDMDVTQLNDGLKRFLPGLLGIRFVEAEKERVRAELAVRDDLCTTPGVLHGGAVMAFADTLGAVGSVLNLPPGASTTTIESKTNFLSAGKGGTTVEGDCTPLHRGRRTMVWQTRILAPDGKVIALVTQTQAVLLATRNRRRSSRRSSGAELRSIGGGRTRRRIRRRARSSSAAPSAKTRTRRRCGSCWAADRSRRNRR